MRFESSVQCPDPEGKMGKDRLVRMSSWCFWQSYSTLPRLAWCRVSDHLFRWTQLAHMTDPALDQIEGRPGPLGIGLEYEPRRIRCFCLDEHSRVRKDPHSPPDSHHPVHVFLDPTGIRQQFIPPGIR